MFSVRLFADQSEVRPRGLDGVGFPGEPDRWDLDARFELAARLPATESELLAGIVQDPVFGPLVALGPGGVLAELIGSANFALAPLTDIDAAELVTTGKAAKLVDGWRGAPGADRPALVDLLHRLSRLAVDLPEVAELDLNPVLAGPAGCVALDTRIRIARPSGNPTPKTW